MTGVGLHTFVHGWRRGQALHLAKGSACKESLALSMIVPDARKVADYYNTPSTLKFYQSLWGGSDIHVGLYKTGSETIAEASSAMTRHLFSQAGLVGGERVLDIACGFGGTLRILADMECDAAGIDIAEKRVEYARRANTAAGLGDAVTVSVGDFQSIDSAAEQWDAVVCQESLIHSPDRPRVHQEVYRVLRLGGTFVISDIMRAPSASIARVHLITQTSPPYCRNPLIQLRKASEEGEDDGTQSCAVPEGAELC